MRIRRVEALSGAAFAVLLVAGALVIGNGEWLPPVAEVGRFYADDATRVIAGGYMGLVSAGFLLWFSGLLGSTIEDAPEHTRRLAATGGAVCALAIAIGSASHLVAAERALSPEGLSPDAAGVLFDLGGTLLGNVAGIGLAVLIGAVAVAWRQTGSASRWAVWGSAVLAIGLVSPVGYLALAPAAAWLLVISLLLSRTTSPSQPTLAATG